MVVNLTQIFFFTLIGTHLCSLYCIKITYRLKTFMLRIVYLPTVPLYLLLLSSFNKVVDSDLVLFFPSLFY